MRGAIVLCLAAPLLGGCAFGRLKPGLTKEGAALSVAAPTQEAARREAVTQALDFFLPPGSARSGEIVSRAAEFTGRIRFKDGRGLVEVRFSKLLPELDKDGLLRPAGFAAGPPRVLLLVSEPQSVLDLGIGPAADALRRGLSAQGLSAIDGRDALNEYKSKGGEPAALAEGAAKLGADHMIVAAASAGAEYDPQAGLWRGRATLVADDYEVKGAVPIGQIEAEASSLDVSSAAARAMALERAGEEAASKIGRIIARASGDRSEGAVAVAGDFDPARVKALLSALRRVDGVAGAHLGAWGGEEMPAVLRVFVDGLKMDGLAARLLRIDPTITLLSVEPEIGRLAVELPGRGDME